MKEIYVASSWRNTYQPVVVSRIRELGYRVYDFRNPAPDDTGFSWAEIDLDWKGWGPHEFREGLRHDVAERGYGFDMGALRRCDGLVYLQPCGVSASLELGWAAGAGKKTLVLLHSGEPELMLKMADNICLSLEEVLVTLAKVLPPG